MVEKLQTWLWHSHRLWAGVGVGFMNLSGKKGSHMRREDGSG